MTQMISPEDAKAERKRRGLTQATAAELIGVAGNTYSLWENGKRELPKGSHMLLTELFSDSSLHVADPKPKGTITEYAAGNSDPNPEMGDLFVPPFSWEEEVRYELIRALDDGWADLGVSADDVYQFTEYGWLPEEKIRSIEEALIEQGYFRKYEQKVERLGRDEPKTAAQFIIEELRTLADYLEDYAPHYFLKADRFIATVQSWNGSREKYEAVFRETSPGRRNKRYLFGKPSNLPESLKPKSK